MQRAAARTLPSVLPSIWGRGTSPAGSGRPAITIMCEVGSVQNLEQHPHADDEVHITQGCAALLTPRLLTFWLLGAACCVPR